jgi:tetratricopeptide (TPR) repeat protein
VLKDYEKAIDDFDEAIRYDPMFAAAYLGRATVYLNRKDYQPAIRDLDTAIGLTPKYAAALTKRAEAWAARGNPRKALTDLDDAIAADPKFGLAYREKAWILATCPDDTIRNGKAARLAQERTKDAGGETWEALAAALAETGDFAAAVEWQKKAIADAGYVSEAGNAVRERLKVYEGQKPFRTAP